MKIVLVLSLIICTSCGIKGPPRPENSPTITPVPEAPLETKTIESLKASTDKPIKKLKKKKK